MTETGTTAGKFTGRHMLAILLAFFGVIIAVNVTMAMLATGTWTGLVVDDTYVASQQFNGKAELGRAQAALGWQPDLAIAGGAVRYRMLDKDGRPVRLGAVKVVLRRPTSATEDHSLDLSPVGGGWMEAQAQIRDGVWIVEIDAEAGLDNPYRDVRRILMRNGAVQ